MKYSFDIDEKSLFRGITNDYKKGQSATVHTPLNQSKDENKWRNDIYEFLKGYSSNNITSLPGVLSDKCLKKTTSHAESKVIYFYVFSKFSLDGVPFESDCSFAMYVKEETSITIKTRGGKITSNTHLGRQKLHYPISFTCYTDGFNINNEKVLNKIVELNGGFAYVVNGFDIDDESKTLNFRTTMVGLNGILLSNVFKRKKGVGIKLLVDGIIDQIGISPKDEECLPKSEKSSFIATLEKIQESSRVNGLRGEEYVCDNIKKILESDSITSIVHVSKKYPQSPYDIECVADGKKMYIEVKSTKSEKKSFYMSRGERLFMNKYYENYLLVLVTNVNNPKKRHFKYKLKDIMDKNTMKQESQSVKFVVLK